MLVKEKSRRASEYKVSYLRARIATLIDVLKDLEENNNSQGYIKYNLKNVSKDLEKFGTDFFS